MGSLAVWGAIGGAAKGAEKGILLKQEEESKTKQADIDHQRRMALERLRQTGETERLQTTVDAAMGRVEKQGEQALEQINARGEQAMELEGVRQDARSQLADQEAFNREQLQVTQQEWQSTEKELDRKNAIEIAKLRTAASSGGSNAMVNRQLDRFEARTLTKTEATEMGLPIEKDSPAVFDNMTGTWYLQDGEKLFLASQGETKPRANANQKHIEALYENPNMAGQFYDKFGYLPKGYLQAQMVYDLQRMQSQGSQ